MQFYPSSLKKELEFDRLIDECLKYCFSDDARNEITNIKHYTDRGIIEAMLSELEEMAAICKQTNFPLAVFDKIDSEIALLKIPNYTCSIDAIIKCKVICAILHNIQNFLKDFDIRQFKVLRFRFERLMNPKILMAKFDKVLTKENQIKDDASENLFQIRKSIKDINSELYKKFKRIVTHYKENNFLAETAETIRNGRFVLGVNAEHKRSIAGIIHDQSESGRIIFIEPDELVQMNNKLIELAADEQGEIWKILNKLSHEIRPFADELLSSCFELIGLDIVHAKALFANELHAIKPRFIDQGFDVKDGVHPILFLKNSNALKPTIPFSLFLNSENRILIISGPNAGGKSITMKAMALLQLMLQSGFLVPVNQNSAFSVFTKMCGDITDHQSVDEGLSTYSAKLKLMSDFDRYADQNTFMIIDEFGSGTEPKIGGVIAETLLLRFNSRKVYGIINTHYSNLKALAHKVDGLLNGAMLYDTEHMKPTFQLRVGKPGSSFALELAKNNKLDAKIIADVKRKIGKDHVALEDLLTNLDEQKIALDRERKEWQDKIAKLDALIQNYTQMQSQLEVRKLKLKLEEKQVQIQESGLIQKEILKITKEIREEKNLEKAIVEAERKKQEQQEKLMQFQDLNKKLAEQLNKGIEYDIKIGSPVKLIKYGVIARVVSINKNKLIVEEANMTYNVDKSEIVPMPHAVDTNQKVRIKLDPVSSTYTFKPLLDVRGFRLMDALEAFDVFIDKAILANSKEIRVLHGKGSGQLKNGILKAARTYKCIGEIKHPTEENGGQGVTIIELV